MTPYYDDGKGIVIYHGDVREVLPCLQVEKIDMLLTDPPYGVSMKGVVHDKGDGKGRRNFDFFPNDSHEASTALALESLQLAIPLLGESGSGYIWMGHRQFAAVLMFVEMVGFTTRFLVWSKLCPCPAPPGSGWPSAAELCLYFFRPGRKWTHDGRTSPLSNVLVADAYRFGNKEKNGHPTQKPFGCINPLIEASSDIGDTILDTFMGSGTTLVAAKKMGRKAIGIEINEEFCEIAANRLAQGVLNFTD